MKRERKKRRQRKNKFVQIGDMRATQKLIEMFVVRFNCFVGDYDANMKRNSDFEGGSSFNRVENNVWMHWSLLFR